MGLFRFFMRQTGESDINNTIGKGIDTRKAFRRKRVRRVASVLACVVAFTTSYALILPAITVDQDEGGERAGLLRGEG